MENKFIVRGLISAIITMCIISAIIPITVGNSPRTTERGSMDEGYFFDRSVAYPQSILFFSKIQPCKTNSNDDLSPEEKKKEEPPLITNDGLMNSPWPMKCHDLRHTAQSPYSTINNTGVEKWKFQTDDVIEAAPIIGDDGVIYVGDFDRYIYAIYPNGTEKWRYSTGGWIWSAPAIAEDGTIYVTSYDDFLHAINPNGTRKWKFCAYDSISSSPAIGEDGTIYFGTMGTGYRIYAVNSNGTEKWHYTTGYKIVSDPAIGDDGTIYIGSGDSYLYALYPNGTLRWRFNTGDWIKSHPAIDENGQIYFDSFDGYFYALYPNGTMRWRIGAGTGCGSAAISNDRMIYFAGSSTLRAIYPNNGSVKWSHELEGSSGHSSPAISVDGTIYVSAASSLIAIDSDGTEKWRHYIGKAESSPAIAENGTIYIGSGHDNFGYLHAFGSGNLTVDANGPYSGYVGEEIQFAGTVLGGIPPYMFHWDFGDGNDSNEKNPKYAYSRAGSYVATFNVTDSVENSSNDTASVSIEEPPPIPPTVEITKPENGLYIANVKIRPYLFRIPLIIGDITIEVEAFQEEFGINRVEFYIDNEIQYFDDTEPYSWTWDTLAFFRHTIKVVAVDNTENSASDEITVRKFF